MVVVCDNKWGHNFENYCSSIINVYCIMNIIPTVYLISTWNPTSCIRLLRQNILHIRFGIRMKQTVLWEQKEIYSYRFRTRCHCMCSESHWHHEVNRVQLPLEQQWENQKKDVRNKKYYTSQGVNQHEKKKKRKCTTTFKWLKMFLLKTIKNRPARSDCQLYKQADFKTLDS